MATESPYHAGELLLQKKVRESEIAARNGQALARTIMPGGIPFVHQQRFAPLSTVDPDGRPFLSVLVGAPGFLQSSPAGDQLTIDLTKAPLGSSDPSGSHLAQDPRIGLLVIELATRRRLRINGRVRTRDAQLLSVAIDEAYPNCPKYIQRQHIAVFAERADDESIATDARSLSAGQARLIRASHTCFVGSLNPNGGLDASHRGGVPGFVGIDAGGGLWIPDYPGNSMFNTLGNFMLYPYAALAFLDFEGSRLLSIQGRVEIHLDHADDRGVTGGTRRFWSVRPERVREFSLGCTLRHEDLDPSPFNPKNSLESAP